VCSRGRVAEGRCNPICPSSDVIYIYICIYLDMSKVVRVTHSGCKGQEGGWEPKLTRMVPEGGSSAGGFRAAAAAAMQRDECVTYTTRIDSDGIFVICLATSRMENCLSRYRYLQCITYKWSTITFILFIIMMDLKRLGSTNSVSRSLENPLREIAYAPTRTSWKSSHLHPNAGFLR